MSNHHARRCQILALMALLGISASCEPAAEGPPPDVGAAVPADSVLTVDTLVSYESGLIGEISGLALDESGSVWLADEVNHRLLRVSPDGQTETIGREGSGPGEFQRPRGIAVGDAVEVYDYQNGRVQRLSRSGEYLETYPAPDVLYPPVAMNGDGMVVGGHLGRHNSLARMAGPAVQGEPFRGEARAPAPSEISLGRMREQAEEGEIPEEISNSIVPILGPGGELWLVVQADATVEHYDETGEAVWSRQMNTPEAEAAFERYFEAWDGSVGFGSLPFPWIVRAGALVDDELWLMMDGVGESGSVVLRLAAASGEPINRLVLPLEGRGGYFAVDRDRGFLYVGETDEGSLVRVSLP